MDQQPNYWQFSNAVEGYYSDSIWDMGTIKRTNQFPAQENLRLRSSVKMGDIVYLRIYGDSYIGKFTVGSDWTLYEENENAVSDDNSAVGFFQMENFKLWQKPLPQSLVMRELSNGDVRSRIIALCKEDGVKIETAQLTYERLGFGYADGEIWILEKGLEEAIKPNLESMGLTLAEDNIQQQFSMGPDVGRSDLICVDKNGDLVIIELKRGIGSREAVGQVSAYVQFVRENIASENQKVYGWIVAGGYDEQLRLAAKGAGVKLLIARLA